MSRVPRDNFYIIATWYHNDPVRYQQWNIPADSYKTVIRLTEKIYKNGLGGLGRPDSISIEKINTN